MNTRDETREDQFSIIWTKEDIVETAKEYYDGIELTDNQIKDVMNLCVNEHDATIGINWDVISYWIGHVLDDNRI